jgi:cysteine desulfurase
MRIYLDHNAGAPIRPEVRDAIAAVVAAGEANPASVHQSGQRARRSLEQARAEVADLIGAAARDIVFTSGGTESNNLAIHGMASAHARRRRIVSSAIEHSSILAPLKLLESRGFDVVLIPPDRNGRIASETVEAVLDADTLMVTLGRANSEVGTIQPTAAIAAAAKRAGALIHVDAAQAVGRIPVIVDELGCDLLTISGHKLGAPAGIGALYVRQGTAIASIILGGPQEAGMRAGTPNLLGAVALGAAARAVRAELEKESLCVATLARRLLERLRAAIPGLRLNGAAADRIANTLNLSFPGVLGESMLIALDLEGVEVSMGSACAAGAIEPSHVLLAMGLDAGEARSSLRLSLGWSTSALEIERAAEVIPRVWRRVMSAEAAASEASGERGAEALR